jgi:hypothetical protein
MAKTESEIRKSILASSCVGGTIRLKENDTEYITVANKLCKLGMLQRLSHEYYSQFPVRYKILRKSQKR